MQWPGDKGNTLGTEQTWKTSGGDKTKWDKTGINPDRILSVPIVYLVGMFILKCITEIVISYILPDIFFLLFNTLYLTGHIFSQKYNRLFFLMY